MCERQEGAGMVWILQLYTYIYMYVYVCIYIYITHVDIYI